MNQHTRSFIRGACWPGMTDFERKRMRRQRRALIQAERDARIARWQMVAYVACAAATILASWLMPEHWGAFNGWWQP